MRRVDIPHDTGWSPTSSAVAIGTFDGVHLGHRTVITRAIIEARRTGSLSGVVTFDRHPADLLAPDRAPGYITCPAEQERQVAGIGPDFLAVLRFDEELAGLSAEDFIRQILAARLHARVVIVGEEFRFGHRRQGGMETLRSMGAANGFEVVTPNPLVIDGAPASSTRIRAAIRRGDAREARRMLGRPYALQGTVVEGLRLGRTMGFPTINLELDCAQVLPLDGVYAALCILPDARTVSAALSIGRRESVAGAGFAIEAHLLDFAEDLYGCRVELRLVELLRPQEAYADLAALTRQIEQDCRAVREILTKEADRASGEPS